MQPDGFDFKSELQKVVSRAVHDCNNHITTILTSCDLINMQTSENVPLKKIENIKSRGLLLARIMKALNQYSKLDSSEISIEFSILEKVNKVIELYREDISKHSIKVALKIDSDLKLRLPPLKFELLIEQFIKNSIEELRKNEKAFLEVQASVSDDGKSFVFEVADNGTVIEPEVLEQMFKPFIKSKENATGMGLCFAKALAAQMNGNVFYERRVEQNVFKAVLAL